MMEGFKLLFGIGLQHAGGRLMNFKSLFAAVWIFLGITACTKNMEPENSTLREEMVVFSKDVLKDKIKGAWAAQTIDVMFGEPIEFKNNSTRHGQCCRRNV